MSKARKTLQDILSGRSDANIAFSDLCHLLERAGFTRKPGKGSHAIFHMEGVDEIISCQKNCQKNPLQGGVENYSRWI